MVTFGRTMVLWSDESVVARLAISKIVEASNQGDLPLTMEDVRASYGHDQEDLNRLAFVYHYQNDNGSILRWHWGCDHRIEGPFDLLAQGTGVWNYLDNLQFNVVESRFKPGIVFPDIISRMLSHALLESLGTQSLDFLYGGWFEVYYRVDGACKKLPYAVQFWNRDGMNLTPGTLLFAWYRGYDLCVSKCDDTHSGKEARNFWVKDFLKRPSAPPKYPIVPAFVYHAIFDKDQSTPQGYIDPFGLMDLALTENGLRIWQGRRLAKILTKVGRSHLPFGNITIQ